MLNAGGGPLDVSIPWLLRDAGGLLVLGDRSSLPEPFERSAKYEADEVESTGDVICAKGGEVRGLSSGESGVHVLSVGVEGSAVDARLGRAMGEIEGRRGVLGGLRVVCFSL